MDLYAVPYLSLHYIKFLIFCLLLLQILVTLQMLVTVGKTNIINLI